MDNILQIVRQEYLENRFNRKHIDGLIREAIALPETQAKVEQGVKLLNEWLGGDYHHESKKQRISQLLLLDLHNLVTDLFVGIAYIQKPQLFTTVTAQLAGRLGFSEKREAIQTVAEVLSVLCLTNAFDITKEDKKASLMIVNRMHIPDETKVFISNCEYLPPMVCEPLELESNYDSGYLTHKDSLILGTGNHHNGNICLDVLNKMNRVRLKLDVDFLLALEEDKSFELKSEDEFNAWVVLKKKHKQFPSYAHYVAYVEGMWEMFKSTSAKMYMKMVDAGNEFHLTHKVDKRGRIYACGYHISTMGNAYKKAMIELANEEVVEGVPV